MKPVSKLFKASEMQSTFNSYQIKARKSEKQKRIKRCYSKLIPSVNKI